MEQASQTEDLVERARRGDTGAFSTLFSGCRPRLAVLIHYNLGPRLRSSVTVDDVFQETWLRALGQMDQFTTRGPGSFMRWLGVIARHVIADEARSQSRQKRRAEQVVRFRSESNPNGPDPAVTITPSRLLSQKEGLRNLLGKLDSLPPQYREVILLSRIEQRTTREIAEHLGQSREATALLLHRALKRFHTLLDDETPGSQKKGDTRL